MAKRIIEIQPLRSMPLGIEFIPDVDTIVRLTKEQRKIWKAFRYIEKHISGFQHECSMYCHNEDDFLKLMDHWNKIYKLAGWSYSAVEVKHENP